MIRLIAATLFVCLAILFGGVGLTSAYGCKHEEKGKIYSFSTENSTTASRIKPFCMECNRTFTSNARFYGTPNDLSYLDVVREQCGVGEFVGGEYYTITATVSLEDYESNETSIRCQVRSEDVIVGFRVEFPSEFEEAVGLIEEGDEITFYGRLYDEGFGFKDAVLITK